MRSNEPKARGATDPTGEPSDRDLDTLGARVHARGYGTRRRWLAAALLLALIGFGISCFHWNLLKGYVERRVSIATGRGFHIDGDLDVELSMNPLVTMDGLRLDNIAGARTPVMASMQRLQFRIALWPLLHGQTMLPEMHLAKPVLLLERDASGRDNWTFPASGANPVIRQFTIDGGVLTYREQAAHTDLVIHVQSDAPVSASEWAPLEFQGNGTYRNNLFSLQGRADSPLELSRTTTPYRIDIGATAGATRAHASGALHHPLQIDGFDLDFSLAGPDLGELYRLIGVATPETPPYLLQGRLGHAGHVWSFDRFDGVVGSSDLAGDVSIDNNGRRKLMKATLGSRRLDVHDLAGFVGAPAHANPARAATRKQRVEARNQDASERILPQEPYDLDRLRGMDADVWLRAHEVVGTKVPLDALAAHLLINDGVAQLDPLDFDAADGQVRSRIRLDASGPLIAAAARLNLRRINLAQIAPGVSLLRRSEGRIGADIDIRGDGNSIARMLATSNGHVNLAMNSGRISDLMMAYAGLNIARILKLRISGDHDIAIRCAVGDFVARDGIWTADAFVFDSADTVISGSGNVDLRNEQLDLLLKTRPKYRSLLTLRSPLHLRGSFSHPSIRPDFKAIGARGVATAILGAIAPPAAELALIEYGGGKDSDCQNPHAGSGMPASIQEPRVPQSGNSSGHG